MRKKIIIAVTGAVISPATPSFYSLPHTIDDLIDTVINRILDLAGFENDGFRWQGGIRRGEGEMTETKGRRGENEKV